MSNYKLRCPYFRGRVHNALNIRYIIMGKYFYRLSRCPTDYTYVVMELDLTFLPSPLQGEQQHGEKEVPGVHRLDELEMVHPSPPPTPHHHILHHSPTHSDHSLTQ